MLDEKLIPSYINFVKSRSKCSGMIFKSKKIKVRTDFVLHAVTSRVV